MLNRLWSRGGILTVLATIVVLAIAAAPVLAQKNGDPTAAKKKKQVQFALNADKLDNKDSTQFFSDTSRVYEVAKAFNIPAGLGTSTADTASCDAGDRLLSGGADLAGTGIILQESSKVGTTEAWEVEATNFQGTAQTITVEAYCLDFPPLRP